MKKWEKYLTTGEQKNTSKSEHEEPEHEGGEYMEVAPNEGLCVIVISLLSICGLTYCASLNFFIV